MSSTSYSGLPGSVSEDHGLAAIPASAELIYSVGISTAGLAEIRMVNSSRKRKVIATTIDKADLRFAEQVIAEQGLSDRIEAKIEDVATPLPYPAEHFDYIYARLVLHYLSEAQLQAALTELCNVEKSGGFLYVVVRSSECPDAKRPDAVTDPRTHLTSWHYTDAAGKEHRGSRFFHAKDSISNYVKQAGYDVKYVKSYDEQLFSDFNRSVQSKKIDNVIEVLAQKPVTPATKHSVKAPRTVKGR